MNNDLKKYIENNVFPEYEKNDSGHGIEHIKYVIERCFKFAEQFDDINSDMLYTMAAYHDIGHHIKKKNHEIISAEFFYCNDDMKRFFNENQRIIIKEGIEDHRASAEHSPRSVYGKILSSADRSTDINDFLRRTHLYTLRQNPDSSINDMVDRAYKHTSDKYGKNGYSKTFVIDEDYEKFLHKIDEMLSDKEKFKKYYIQLNNL